MGHFSIGFTGGGSSPPATIGYVANANLTSGSGVWSSSIGIGSAASDRYIAVVMHTLGVTSNANGAVTSVSVGGVNCSKLVEVANPSGATTRTSIWLSDNPITSGTSETLVANITGSTNNARVATYRVQGLLSLSAQDTDTNFGSNGLSVSVDVPAGGVVIAAATARADISTSGNTTTSGIVEDYDLALNSGVATRFVGGGEAFASAQTVAATFTFTGTNLLTFTYAAVALR